MLRLRHSGSIGSKTPVTPSLTSRPASVTSQASIATDIAEVPGKRSRRNTPLITVEDHDAPRDAPAPAEIFHEAGYEGSNMVANPMYGNSGKA